MSYRRVFSGPIKKRLPEGGPSGPAGLGGGHLGILIWLSPLLYPVAVAALFYNAALARQIGAMGIVLLVLSLFWALSGPFFALRVLNRLQKVRVDAMWHRAIVYGALVAAVSPPLLLLLRNTGLGLAGWYGSFAFIGASTLLPVSESKTSNNRLRSVHRISALLIGVFALVHIANHVCAFHLLPYYLLGVLAFFTHIGCPVRWNFVDRLSRVTAQRLSYTVFAIGGLAVLTIGFALCGLHVGMRARMHQALLQASNSWLYQQIKH